MKDIVFRHAGKHVNKHALIIVLGNVTQHAEADVFKNVVSIVQDVLHVQEHVRDKHIQEDVLAVELRVVVHHLVNTIAIKIVLGGVVVLFVV